MKNSNRWWLSVSTLIALSFTYYADAGVVLPPRKPGVPEPAKGGLGQMADKECPGISDKVEDMSAPDEDQTLVDAPQEVLPETGKSAEGPSSKTKKALTPSTDQSAPEPDQSLEH